MAKKSTSPNEAYKGLAIYIGFKLVTTAGIYYLMRRAVRKATEANTQS